MADNDSSYKPPKQVTQEHQEAISDIGTRLEALRKKKGISASQLCIELKLSRNSYRQMERGEIYFSLENFIKVLGYHQISVTEFFSDIEKS